MEPEDPYGTSKVLGEEVAEMVTRRFDVPVVSLRISNVQYPGNYTVLDGRDDLDSGIGNFWSYVDGRDVATAIERTTEVDVDGHEAFIVAADENYLDRPTEDAIREAFGKLPDCVDLSGEQAALSNRRARDELGWRPRHTWRSAAEEDIPVPHLTEG